MADQELIDKVRRRELTVHDMVRLAQEGKHTEARKLLAALKVVAANEPNQFSTSPGKPPVFKRRGRVVVQKEDGSWELKNPSKKRVT